MAFPEFDVKLAIVRVILLAVVLPLVSGICTGDGSVTDTCPDGEYCDRGECYNCSLCSVDALLGGRSLAKCLCVETSAKICDAMQDSGNQLIEDPSQLSPDLEESYNRSSIDCTVPTTTKESTTTPSSRPRTSSEVTTSERGTLGGTTKEPTTSTKCLDFVHGIIIGIGAMVALIFVALVIFFIIRKYALGTGGAGAGDGGTGDATAGDAEAADDGTPPETVPLSGDATAGDAEAADDGTSPETVPLSTLNPDV